MSPRSRYLFALSALAALSAPFAPDLVERGRRTPPWIVSEGPASLLAALPFAVMALTGGWDPVRERIRVCLAVVGVALIGSWMAVGIASLAPWGAATIVTLVAALATPVALFGTFMLTREWDATAVCARFALAAQAVASSLPYWGQKEAGAACAYVFAASGTLLALGEVFDWLSVKDDGRLIR